MLSTLSNTLLNLTAQASAVQSGRVTNVYAVTISGGKGMHYASQIGATVPGYDIPAQQVKSPLELLQEQVDKVLATLQDGLDGAADSLRSAWAAAIERGEMTGDAQAGLDQITATAGDDTLPETMRDMVKTYALAENAMKDLRVQASTMMNEAREKQGKADKAEMNRMISITIEYLVDSQLSSEAGIDSMEGARIALALIRQAREGEFAADVAREGSNAEGPFAEIMESARAAALQTRRSALIDDLNARIERGDLQISVQKASYWGEPDVTVTAAPGHAAIVSRNQVDHYASATVTASLTGGIFSLLV